MEMSWFFHMRPDHFLYPISKIKTPPTTPCLHLRLSGIIFAYKELFNLLESNIRDIIVCVPFTFYTKRKTPLEKSRSEIIFSLYCYRVVMINDYISKIFQGRNTNTRKMIIVGLVVDNRERLRIS